MFRKFTDIYDVKEELGRGGFGTVVRCVHKENGLQFAAKTTSKRMATPERLEDIEDEERICRKLRHPNIVRLHHVIHGKYLVYMIFDLVTGGELMHDLQDRTFYSEKDASFCIQQILKTVNYCHINGIIHRDLKPENILLASKLDATIKVADFGLAVEVVGPGEYDLNWCGTVPYMAPEILMHESYGQAVDIWACGVILYILLCGDYPFDGDNDEEIVGKIINRELYFSKTEWNTITPEAKDLVNKMLTYDPHKRITAAEALKHPWIYQRERVRKKYS